jgi:hypothetical protein
MPVLAGLRGFAWRAPLLPSPRFWPFTASLFSVSTWWPRETRALSPAGTPLFAPYYANSRKDGLWVTYFNGGSSLTLPDNANVANFGTGDFTVELRLALHDGGHGSAWPRILETNHYPNPGGWGLVGSASENPGRLRFDLSDGSPLLITPSALTNLTYYHVAITRAAGQLRLFLDGVLQGAWPRRMISAPTASGWDRI